MAMVLKWLRIPFCFIEIASYHTKYLPELYFLVNFFGKCGIILMIWWKKEKDRWK